MQASEVLALLEEKLDNCEIDVQGEGAKFHITAKGAVFAGLSPVKQQQLIYAVLNEYISSGEIHAVTMSLSA